MNNIYLTDPVFWQRFLKCAGYYTSGIDGDFGPLSKKAAIQFELDTAKIGDQYGFFDSRSEDNIKTLLPATQRYTRQFLAKVINTFPGYSIKIISGTRTFNEQDALYAQGRSTSGSIVTNARGGQSNHNFGVAFDIGVFQFSNYLDESPIYSQCGKIWESLGEEWGGEWSNFADFPHMELKPDWAKNLTENETVNELNHRFENGILV